MTRELNRSPEDRQISRPAAAAASHPPAQRPSSLLAVAGERQIAGAAPPAPLQRNPQIPITSRSLPAGSYMGGFRTPARAQTRHLRRPASENLHHCGHAGASVWFPKAAKAFWVVVGLDGWRAVIRGRQPADAVVPGAVLHGLIAARLESTRSGPSDVVGTAHLTSKTLTRISL